MGRVLGRHGACRKALEHSGMTEPLRRAATVSLCHWALSSTEGNGACRKALEQSRMTEPLRPSALSDINSQSQLVAVAQSSWSVLVPSYMLHGDREPVPSDPIGVEWHKLTVAHGCSSGPIWTHFGSLRKIFSTLWADIEGPRVQNFIKNMIFERFRKCRVGLKKTKLKNIENS